MDMYPKYKSPFGYETGDNGVDSYGVDHSGFSLRDEIEYQTARDQRESQLMQMYNNQGITENYPQYTTNFWGDAGNNYGFGSSNISQNIQKMTDQLYNRGFSGELNEYQFDTNNHTQAGSMGSTMTGVGNSLTNNIIDRIGYNSALTLTTPDNTNSYTTESAWGYPNSTQSPYYQQMGNPYNLNHNSLYEPPSAQQPYIFSEDMRNRLGRIESGNNYGAHNTDGGGFGALGKYQIRRDGFIDMGYLDKNYNWTGKNGISSINDFLTSPEKQEQILDEYLKSNYGQLKNKGSLNYLGAPMQGVVNNFDITNTGLLAASHREGAGAVNNYLNHLVKNQNGRYYINYDSMSDRNLIEMFKRIETRLRNFEK